MSVSEHSGEEAVPATLQAALNPGQIRRPADEDSLDGLCPRAVLTPRSEEDLQRIVRESAREQLALVATGGTTRLGIGNPPARYDLRVCMTGMAQIVEHSPDDMTVTAEAGVSLSRLSGLLATHGQRLAADVPEPERATVGGLIATNLTGGLANGYGLPRDLVLGLRVVDGKARALRAGGNVVKNVSGYDLVRLFTGSFGTLGVITQATFRVHPIPPVETALRIPLADGAGVDRLRAAVAASHLPVSRLDVESREPGKGWLVSALIAGTESEVEYQHRLLSEFAGTASIKTGTDESPLAARSTAPLVMRVCTAPTGCRALLEALEADVLSAFDETRAFGRLGDAFFRVEAGSKDLKAMLTVSKAVRAAADRTGARTVVERAPLEIKRLNDVWGMHPPGYQIMERVKRTFDPDDILAPGRFVGKL